MVGCGKQEPAIDIWAAAATGDIAAIKQHVDFGTDINAKESANGSTPLIVAAFSGHTDAMRLLVENGAGLDLQNNQGSTALHTAAFICYPDAVALLLDRGANTEIKNNFGRTALESVSGEWNAEIESRYVQIAKALNLELDLERIKAVRPQVAELIRQHNER